MAAQASGLKAHKGRNKAVRRRLPEILLGLAAIVLYVVYLNQQDMRVRAHFQQSRVESPERYLEEVRVVQGFDAYLNAYAELFGENGFSEKAPDFLIGRWALFDHPLRVGDQFSTASCRNAVLVENGRLTLPDMTAPTPAEYWLSGNRVIVRLDNGHEIIVRLASSGIHLHHLEIDRGAGQPIGFAYRCA